MQNDKKKYVCNTVTGAIRLKVSYFGNPKLKENEVVLEDKELPLPDYFYDSNSKSIKERHSFRVGNWDNDYYTLLLPANTEVIWQSEKYTVEDGVLEVMVDQAGSHAITLIHPHYKTEVRYLENPEKN
ncbi:hypothetical protein vBAmePPT11V19_00005 [Alteromonas phage vB_AmeP_PT11-V19]|nr:hypothetical protein vBAmePPT11V19_00005 [Alteromonas phage vB_AmeP_PT11-V19]